MRGEVLLVLDQPGPRALYAECFRAHALRVYEAKDSQDALNHLDTTLPDVIVTSFRTDDGPWLLQELRRRTDHATSIIAVSAPDQQAPARRAGADCLVSERAVPADVLYEVRRALILRRSGRRLPWNDRSG